MAPPVSAPLPRLGGLLLFGIDPSGVRPLGASTRVTAP
jgi:hypothetical protein